MGTWLVWVAMSFSLLTVSTHQGTEPLPVWVDVRAGAFRGEVCLTLVESASDDGIMSCWVSGDDDPPVIRRVFTLHGGEWNVMVWEGKVKAASTLVIVQGH